MKKNGKIVGRDSYIETEIDNVVITEANATVDGINPVLTEYGVREALVFSIQNEQEGTTPYYSIDDGTTWVEYSNPVSTIVSSLKVKMVRDVSKLSSEVKDIELDSSLASSQSTLSNILYDNDLNTGISSENSSKVFYIDVLSNVIDSDFIYTFSIGGGGSLGVPTVKVELLNENNDVLDTKTENYVTSTKEGNIKILPNTKKIRITLQHGSDWGGTSNTTLYEIGVDIKPRITGANGVYPLLTSEGVVKDDDTININYHPTSITYLYKIDEGEWLNYTSQIKVKPGQKVYAKGITKDGISTREAIYEPVIKTDAIPEFTYTGDGTESISSNNSTNVMYLNIDESAIGKNMTFTYTIGGGGSTGIPTLKVEILDDSEIVLNSFLANSVTSKREDYINVPANAKRARFTLTFGSGWGGSSNSSLFSVGIN